MTPKIERMKPGVPNNGCNEDFSKVTWEDLKLNAEGLIPVIVQEDCSGEVVMMAYMNREAFELTLKTHRMTYYSRSRQELWLKGETSGHFQYVHSLYADCDKDTLLARITQIGAACHTGRHSCFFQEIFLEDSNA